MQQACYSCGQEVCSPASPLAKIRMRTPVKVEPGVADLLLILAAAASRATDLTSWPHEYMFYYPPPGLGVHSPLGDRGALTNPHKIELIPQL
jgi:hypothetical protein